MQGPIHVDHEPSGRLPLPLAQLLRRTRNAAGPVDRCLEGLMLFEATVKLLGTVAVVDYAARDDHDSRFDELLKNLSRPALGHWWSFGRELTKHLADEGDPAYVRLRRTLLDESHDDLAHCAGLDAVLTELLDGRTSGRSTVRLGELVDRLIECRNKFHAHGPLRALGDAKLRRLGDALLAGLTQLLERIDPLVGGRLTYVADVRQSQGSWIVERLALVGEHAEPLPPQTLARDAAPELPDGGRVYLQRGDESAAAPRPLYPLVLFEPGDEEFFYLNARRGKLRTDYVCYTSGKQPSQSEALRGRHLSLLAELLRMPVDEAAADAWAAHSQAEDGPVPDGDDAPEHASLGEFELISELGRGGMGVVYRAWQPRLRRQVAVKKLLHGDGGKSQERFEREIRALGRVEHPHLVKVFTSGNDGVQSYFAMELVEGVPLSSVCEALAASTSSADDVSADTWHQAVSTACSRARQAEKPLSSDKANVAATDAAAPAVESRVAPASLRGGRDYVERVVELVRQAALAAHALHEHGIIHRDIKPGNVMVTADGAKAVLMDLGLAQWSDEQEGKLTRTRQFVGTLRYAGPQQIAAVEALDARADVYSLGATLWELLALRPLLDLDDSVPFATTFERIQRQEPAPLRRYNRAVSRDLETVVARCLDKTKERRYETAQDLADDLGRVLAGEPVHARRATPLERTARWIARRPQAAALWGLLILAAVLGTGLASAYLSRQEALAARDDAESQRQIAELERSEADTARQEADRARTDLAVAHSQLSRIAYAERITLAGREWDAGNIVSARRLLSSCQTELWDHCGWEASHLDLKFHSERLVIQGHKGLVASVAFNADGTRIVSGGADGSVRVWDAVDGRERQTFSGHEGSVGCVAFSSDGARIFSGGHDGSVLEWDVVDGSKRHKVIGNKGSRGAIAFSPDGTRVVYGCADGNLRVWDVANGHEWHKSVAFERGVGNVAFNADGEQFVCYDPSGALLVWNTADERELKKFAPNQGWIASLAFSRDGTRIVSGGDDKTIRVWDAATGRELQKLTGHESWVTAVAFNPDGTRIVSGGEDDTVRVWNVDDGRELQKLVGHQGSVQCLAFSPDGTSIVSGGIDGSVRVWAPSGVLDRQKLTGYPGLVESVVFSPDGTRIVSGGFDGIIRMWKAVDGREPEKLTGHKNSISSVGFSPDGARIISGGYDGSVRLWDVADGRELREIWGHAGFIHSAVFSPDGTRIVGSGHDGSVRVWNAADGREVLKLSGHVGWVASVAFSPDGSRIASGGQDGSVRIWNAVDGSLCHMLSENERSVLSVAFSPDGTQIVSGGQDGSVRIWSASDGRQYPMLSENERSVLSVAFSPDGKRIVSSGEDSYVRVWDAADGRELQKLSGHGGWVYSAAFSSDGSLIISGGQDGVIIWLSRDAHRKRKQ